MTNVVELFFKCYTLHSRFPKPTSALWCVRIHVPSTTGNARVVLWATGQVDEERENTVFIVPSRQAV